MSLKRSKSAPQPIATLITFNLPRSHSQQHLQQNAQIKGLRGPAVSPTFSRADREDPFSLSGFFPSSFGGLEEEEEWNWLREEHEEEGYRRSIEPLGIAEDDASVSSLPGTPASVMFGHVEDELTREAIKGEDKLGVLSLDTLFSGDEQIIVADDRLFSPYLGDDPVDHDSLHLALRRRREGHGLVTKSTGSSTSFDQLFLPGGVIERRDYEKAPHNSWTTLLDSFLG